MVLDETLNKAITDRFSNVHCDEFAKEYVLIIKIFY
jgi:hypothetical protein